ncbi:LysR family transcriptional regulator [Cryptosporangium sp. NPDC051539]|uniref:LysR family transcriptional regulator n=1 Tax=Cryptosporangium sp. NPDC051539 TaxID=3363962 RepID=UPI0037B53C09
MGDLEVRQLRYFVAVAEELHFGRAAERLGMAQPPLSRAIREIERQLGVQLLERTTRQVALTSAGETLLGDARTALEAVEAAGRRARNAGRSEPRLRLAFKADYDGGLLPRMLALFERDPSARPVELLMGGRGEQAPALREGRADVALLWLPPEEPGLDLEPLLTEARVVVLAANDPLAARTSLALADLAGRLLPDGTDAGGGGLLRLPPARPQRDLAQIFSLVEVGSLVWFLPVSLARRHARPGLAYREVTDLAPSTLAVAWPADSHSPAVAAFVRAALEVAADTQEPSVLAAGGGDGYS